MPNMLNYVYNIRVTFKLKNSKMKNYHSQNSEAIWVIQCCSVGENVSVTCCGKKVSG